jgi:hypothetical protein
MSKQDSINAILNLRDKISESVTEIETIISSEFPEFYGECYQHWVPQIQTALYNDTIWLPRGERSLQDTIDGIKDNFDDSGGVSKFIK